MTPGGPPGPSAAAATPVSERDIAALLFIAEMYAVQTDHLAVVLGVAEARARAVAADWRRRGLAESARIGPGPPWVWLTRAGLAACGLPYTAAAPALSRLAHLRAVTAVRLALAAVPSYAAADAHWRSERRLRARTGGKLGLREHLPDAEVHWPEGGAEGTAGGHGAGHGGGHTDRRAAAWAGECWAVEAELTRKTVTRTAAIMQEILARTGDYGCPAAQAHVPGAPPRHTRALYLCSAAAQPTVTRARDSLGTLAARIEIRPLPPGWALRAAGQ